MPLGTLIQPFVIVEWGDIKLTPFETDSLKIPESVITGASVLILLLQIKELAPA